jgi:hypothetical protein
MHDMTTAHHQGESMTTPKLPDRFDVVTRAEGLGVFSNVAVWNREDMLSYAAECVAAERERCAKVCEDLYGPNDWFIGSVLMDKCAAAIRAGADK